MMEHGNFGPLRGWARFPYPANMDDAPSAEAELRRLLDIMAALRDPATGCPWDKEQSFDTIAPYTIEEAYEVADSIARRDFAALPPGAYIPAEAPPPPL